MIIMDVKGITWVGSVYQKFEAMCLEVEEVMYQVCPSLIFALHLSHALKALKLLPSKFLVVVTLLLGMLRRCHSQMIVFYSYVIGGWQYGHPYLFDYFMP